MIINTLKYSILSTEELKKITAYWAIGNRLEDLLDSSLHPQNGKFVFHMVNPKDLISNVDFQEVNTTSLFTGNNNNDTRISMILNLWESKKSIDPPSICYSEYNKNIVFYDGRHRTKLSYFLDIKIIPVAIYKEDVEQIKSLLTSYSTT